MAVPVALQFRSSFSCRVSLVAAVPAVPVLPAAVPVSPVLVQVRFPPVWQARSSSLPSGSRQLHSTADVPARLVRFCSPCAGSASVAPATGSFPLWRCRQLPARYYQADCPCSHVVPSFSCGYVCVRCHVWRNYPQHWLLRLLLLPLLPHVCRLARPK